MAERVMPNNASQNRIKVIMIPVLGVIMLYMLFAPAEKVVVPTLVARKPEGQAANGAPSSPADNNLVPVTWPTIPLAEVLATNPFQLPDGLKPYKKPEPEAISQPVAAIEPVVPATPPISAAEQAAKEEALAAELREAAKTHRLTALVRTSKGIGAMVGDHVVMVGDKIDDRFRVAAIRPDGVVLELIERPADAASALKR